MASELIDQFCPKTQSGETRRRLAQAGCAGCGRRIRRHPRGRARGTLVVFHQRCLFVAAPSREGRAMVDIALRN